MSLQPLAKLAGLEQEAERSTLAAINALITEVNLLRGGPRLTALQVANYNAREGDLVRASPGIAVNLPRARPENQAKEIGVLLERPGSIRITATSSLVNGARTVDVTRVGLTLFRSNGEAGWFSSDGESSLSEGGFDGTFHVQLPSSSLPNARVAATSAEIEVSYAFPGFVSWALRTASVVFAKLQNLTGLSVLGRAANSSGVMAAITAGTQGHHLMRVNDTLAWGDPAGAGMTLATTGVMNVVAGTGVTVAADSVSLALDVLDDGGTLLGTSPRFIQGSDSATITEDWSVVGGVPFLRYDWVGLPLLEDGISAGTATSLDFTDTATVAADVSGAPLGVVQMSVVQSADFTWTGSHSFGDVVLGAGVFTTSFSVTTSNLAIGAVNCVRIEPGAPSTLTGMVPTADGQWVFLENTSDTSPLTLAHDSTSTAANRFYCPGLVDLVILIRGGVWLRYDATLSRWMVAIQRSAGISVRDNPTVYSGTISIDFIEGSLISIGSSSASNQVDLTIGVAAQAAGTVVANVTAGSAAPTAHSLTTLAGAGISYTNVTGIMAVDSDPDAHIFTESGASGQVMFRKSRHRHFFFDDFDHIPAATAGTAVTTTGATFGDWFVQGIDQTGTYLALTGIANHPGIGQLFTNTADNCGMQMFRGDNALTKAWISGSNIYSFEAVVRIPTVTSVFMEIGFKDTLASGTNVISFVFDTDADATVHTRTVEATAATDTDTDVAPGTGWNVYTFIQETAGTIDFYIDDVLEVTSASNIPDTEFMNCVLTVRTRTTVARQLDIDMVSYETRDLGARTS